MFPGVDVSDRPVTNLWNDDASREAVKATGREKLVISGLATEVCASFPALSALRDGHEVYVVVDACADFNSRITDVTVQHLAAAGAIVTTWVAVLAELAANTRENGPVIGSLLSKHVGQYYGAMNMFLGMADRETASTVKEMVGLTGNPPIPYS